MCSVQTVSPSQGWAPWCRAERKRKISCEKHRVRTKTQVVGCKVRRAFFDLRAFLFIESHQTWWNKWGKFNPLRRKRRHWCLTCNGSWDNKREEIKRGQRRFGAGSVLWAVSHSQGLSDGICCFNTLYFNTAAKQKSPFCTCLSCQGRSARSGRVLECIQ